MDNVFEYKQIVSQNDNFRKVILTGVKSQLVAMSLKPNEEIGIETHDNTDQIFFFVNGDGEADVDGQVTRVKMDELVFVKAGKMHNIKNIGNIDLKFLTIYSPPHHPDKTIHKTREEAMNSK